MTLLIDIHGPTPKRGDIVQTNVGDRRERTCLVLRVKRLKPIRSPLRVKVWAERWWQIEPALRLRLYRSAERSGGQGVMQFTRYRAKKQTFERYMRRKAS